MSFLPKQVVRGDKVIIDYLIKEETIVLVVGTDGNDYKLIKEHASLAENKPVTGRDWYVYWELNGTTGQGDVWVVGTAYSLSAAKDVSAMTFKLGVKDNKSDETYKIDPVDSEFITDGTDGKIRFTITEAMTDIDKFNGSYAVAMYDSQDNKTTLTKPGGVEWDHVEDILDVT